MSEHLGVDPERWISDKRSTFPVHELAKMLCCSVQHLWNLIQEGELVVPQANIAHAKTRTTIQVSRESFVEFLRRRSAPNVLAKRRQSRKRRRLRCSESKRPRSTV